MAKTRWSHPSVRSFSPDEDPVAKMVYHARHTVLSAQDAGWTGPPFDPTSLAQLLRIRVVPSQDVMDARTVPIGPDQVQIEFNPERPQARIKYSIAHEIAHTFFPDCSSRIQNRLQSAEITEDEWQLEMLCNIGASEILMPVGSFPELQEESLDIRHLMELRKQFGVSAEALLLRVTRLTTLPCLMFAASCRDESSDSHRYTIDYSVASRFWTLSPLRRIDLPADSCVSECTAIGFTANADERWPDLKADIHVECVGIPPYPGRRLPRVVGLTVPCDASPVGAPSINYVTGDALQPRGDGPHIIAHVSNDVTPNWGGGFARVVKRKWKHVQKDFRDWWTAQPVKPSLGATRCTAADTDVYVFTMLAQHGLGGNATKRKLRYEALARCLEQLASTAYELEARVHMPRIGCGQAGGTWTVVSELVHTSLVEKGIEVFVYDPPDAERRAQKELF